MNENLNIIEMLKLFDVKIDKINYGTILERIELYIDLISTLQTTKILIIPNLKTYLNTEELIELYKYSLYNNINLLLVERKIEQESLKYEKKLQIDNLFNDELI